MKALGQKPGVFHSVAFVVVDVSQRSQKMPVNGNINDTEQHLALSYLPHRPAAVSARGLYFDNALPLLFPPLDPSGNRALTG